LRDRSVSSLGVPVPGGRKSAWEGGAVVALLLTLACSITLLVQEIQQRDLRSKELAAALLAAATNTFLSRTPQNPGDRVGWLLRHGASANARDLEGEPALMLALRIGNVES